LLKELQTFSIPTRELMAQHIKHKYRVSGKSGCTCTGRNTAQCWKWWNSFHEM